MCTLWTHINIAVGSKAILSNKRNIPDSLTCFISDPIVPCKDIEAIIVIADNIEYWFFWKKNTKF